MKLLLAQMKDRYICQTFRLLQPLASLYHAHQENERGWQEPEVYVNSRKLTPIKLCCFITKTAIVTKEGEGPFTRRGKTAVGVVC